MVEEAQGPIGRERGEPEREPRQLHGHRIEVHAVEAALRNRPPEDRSVLVADVTGMTPAVFHHRRFVRACQVPARGHEKRAAAHRRIDHAERQDAFGREAPDERVQRPANEIVGDGLRRVERAGRLANTGPGCQRNLHVAGPSTSHGAALDLWFVVEQRLVDGAKLLDAEIAIGDALASRAIGRRPRRECQHDAPRRLVVQVAALGERRARRREQPAVEGRHGQVARAAARVGEMRDGAQRLPQAGRTARLLSARAQRCQAVAVAVHRVPDRDKSPRLREEQEHDAVDDGERLLEGIGDTLAGGFVDAAEQRSEDACGRGQHTVLQRTAHAGSVAIGGADQCLERRARVRHGPEGLARSWVVERLIEIEFHMPPGKRPAGIDDSHVRAVEEQAPDGRAAPGFVHRGAPHGIQAMAPRGHEQGRVTRRSSDRRGQHRLMRFHGLRRLEPERACERRRAHLKHGAKTG